MKKIDIYKYRSSDIEKNQMVNIDVEVIKNALANRGLVSKQAGLCAPPWDKYYSFSYQDSRGVSYSNSSDKNCCYITVNQATSTYSKTTYFYSIHIVRTKEAYYLTTLAQNSRYHNTKGANHTVYECQEDELNSVLDILFKDVQW